MKYLLTSVAVAAALTVSAPVWAQPASPSGTGAAAPAPAPTPTGRMPAGGRATSERTVIPTAPGQTPMHRHARARPHGKMAKGSAGDAANQLNRDELARIQSGNFSNPVTPAAPDTTGANRMPAGGRATSTRYQ
jgi:hypothetical protein